MRYERLSPLPERDKPRKLECRQNQPFGSVTVKLRRDDSTSATRNSARSDVAPSEGSSILPSDSESCESAGTGAPVVIDCPSQGRPTMPSAENFPQPERPNSRRHRITRVRVKSLRHRSRVYLVNEVTITIPDLALPRTRMCLKRHPSRKSRCAMRKAARAY